MSESNIFAEQDHQQAEHAQRWGLSALDKSTQMLVELYASRTMREKQTTDDAEKQKVYDDVKRHYLEHCETRQSSREITHEPKNDAEEFDRGYKAFWRKKKDLEEFAASQYNQGYEAAEQEYLASDAAKQTAMKSIESSIETNGVNAANEELQQLKEDVKKLDARLKELEKYTKE